MKKFKTFTILDSLNFDAQYEEGVKDERNRIKRIIKEIKYISKKKLLARIG